MADPLSEDELWRSLHLFNYYRLSLGILLVFMAAVFGDSMTMVAHEQARFFEVSLAYALLALAVFWPIKLRVPHFNLLFAIQLSVDIVAITLLTYLSGGIQSNLGLLLLISLAATGLIRQSRITLFYAALASIAMLLEHAYAVLTKDASGGQFFQVGILCTAYFAVALLAQTMSRYAIASEKLAFVRGVDLSNMAEANRLMIQDMPDGVMVVDERGMVRQSNPSAERLLAYTFTPGQEHNLASCSPLLDALFAGWRQNESLGHQVLRLPTSSRLVRLRFLPVQRQGFWGAVVVLEDLQYEQEQAQQVKLAALGRLTVNIAHEVRNPLSSISYAAELLKEGKLSKDQNRLSQIILENTGRLNRIVQDVMQLNRRDRVQAEPIDLEVRLPAFVEELSQTERSSPGIFNVTVEPGCTVNFDRGHFEQVLWNLCLNALRYSQHNDGSVQVKATHSDGNHVALEVSDDGPGVDAESAQKLFEPFFTTNTKGTGLGLYIARELCEANGATLIYQSQEQGGACFCIAFGGEK